MMLLTEEQVTELGQTVIEFLEAYKGTEGLNVGELITILATAVFMIGQSSKEEDEGL